MIAAYAASKQPFQHENESGIQPAQEDAALMTVCEQLAHWSVSADLKLIPSAARERIKLHLLDAIGCAIGALGAEPIEAIRREEASYQAAGPCSVIAGGARTTPERAAFYNGALVRYLDFMDAFVAPHEASHPSDNIAVLLAAAELANASGPDLLTAILVAYQAPLDHPKIVAGPVASPRRRPRGSDPSDDV